VLLVWAPCHEKKRLYKIAIHDIKRKNSGKKERRESPFTQMRRTRKIEGRMETCKDIPQESILKRGHWMGGAVGSRIQKKQNRNERAKSFRNDKGARRSN